MKKTAMRRSSVYFLFLASAGVLWLCMGAHAKSSQQARKIELRERIRLVRELTLTDLCLFTEARYTRHPSMADLHAPFQDHPSAFEHFPSGSLVSPPVTLQRMYAARP